MLLMPNLPKEEAYNMAKKLSQKISSDILSSLINQTKSGTITTISDKKESGFDVEDVDGNVFVLDVGMKKSQIVQMNIINIIKRIESDFNEYVGKTILGMNNGVVGIDYVVRFNSDAEQYLKTKSRKFYDKSFTPNEIFPKTLVIDKIDNVFISLQNLYNKAKLELDGIQQEKSLQYIKGVAYNISRIRHMVLRSKTYVDLMKSYALFHNVISESIVKDKIGRL
jgi:hypothetical protein